MTAVPPSPAPTLVQPLARSQQLERVEGAAAIVVDHTGRRTRLSRLRQSGAAKIRLPRAADRGPLEAILLNTAGGVTGGDQLRYEATVGQNAHLMITSQAAERAYRSADGFAGIETQLDVDAGGHLDWVPQETILFERSRLRRRFAADVAATATLLAVESVVLGRAAMGEVLHDIHFRDDWRIRRGGRLVFADGTRLVGDSDAMMAGGATGGAAVAFATILLVAPGAATKLAAARTALSETESEWGASAWNGLLVARILAFSGQQLRAALVAAIESLRGTPMPRMWNC
ncbi:MAG: urease accessory protein [Hyphomicrobiales bacterium]|nr:urease accessory protein [Hyphomicrobiales bacterium]